MGIIISGGLVTIVMILSVMYCRGCLPDGNLIVTSGLALGIVSLGIELIDHRILAAKLLRQLSREAVTIAINELRQSGSTRKE